MPASSRLDNVSLSFTDASANTGNLSFAVNEFTIDKPVTINQVTTSQVAVSNSGQIVASSDFDNLAASQLELNGATSGSVTLQAAATTVSHTLTLPSQNGLSSSYLRNDGAGVLSWAVIPSTGKLLSAKSFTDAGVQTYTPSTGCSRALVYVIGGGGGGGGALGGATKCVGGGGGGGGCRVGLFAINDSLSGSISVGAGGAGGSAAAGSAGENTTFSYNGSSITGNGGGAGGISQNSDVSWVESPELAAGSSTAINSVLIGSYTVWGSEGFRAENYLNGSNHAGSGGHSVFGGGGRGSGAAGVSAGQNGVPGKNGVGGGASGAFQTNGNVYSGGNGGTGGVYIMEYA